MKPSRKAHELVEQALLRHEPTSSGALSVAGIAGPSAIPGVSAKPIAGLEKAEQDEVAYIGLAIEPEVLKKRGISIASSNPKDRYYQDHEYMAVSQNGDARLAIEQIALDAWPTLSKNADLMDATCSKEGSVYVFTLVTPLDA